MTSSGNLMVLDKASFKRLLKDPVLEFISETELQGLKQKSNKVKILDIRLDSEYQGDEVPDSMHIPFLKLRESMQRLDQSTTYVVHYNGGRRSELAAYLLNEAGLNAIILREDRKRRHA